MIMKPQLGVRCKCKAHSVVQGGRLQPPTPLSYPPLDIMAIVVSSVGTVCSFIVIRMAEVRLHDHMARVKVT